MFLARIIYGFVRLFCSRVERIIVRNGIKYEVDLSEGIDLSMFLFGNFQKHVSCNKRLHLPEDAIIFDVGANCGTMTLQFAQLAPLGKVYSFEPTHYAFSKLKRNLELNPDLAERVSAVQNFVSSKTTEDADIRAYASWKVGGKVDDVRHSIHGGTTKSTDGVGAVSLDDFCDEEEIKRLDLIKIDTDGHEFEVLKGARKIITKFRPAIVFEVGLYLIEENNISFSKYMKFFHSLDYSLFTSGNFREIDEENYCKYIPSKWTVDILALYGPPHENN